MIEATKGYPYFVQEFAKLAWDVAEGPDVITLDAVERPIPVAVAGLDDGFFRVRTGRASDVERAYLRAMAEIGPGPVRSSAVAALLGKKPTAVTPTRGALIKKALCYSPRWGELDFTVPMFGEFMRRLMPDMCSDRQRPPPSDLHRSHAFTKLSRHAHLAPSRYR